MSEQPQYDVALSFAGENRGFVDGVAASLRNAGVRVFYDDYERVELWGKDLYEHLDFVYRKASRYCVMFVSRGYAEKVWTNHERKSAQARAIEENHEYVLPARFDQTEVPGLRPTVGYIDLNGMQPEELAGLIKSKLGPRSATPSFPAKLDRLYKSLGAKPIRAKDKDKRREIRDVAISFYEALGRMSEVERTAVGAVMAFGCYGDLPSGVHISLDYVHRMTRLPKAELVESLSSVRSLNVRVALRDPSHIHAADHDELVSDDKDILLSFWSSRAPDCRDPTRIAYMAVHGATDHFCYDHGLEYIVARDFRLLSSDELADVVDHARHGHEHTAENAHSHQDATAEDMPS